MRQARRRTLDFYASFHQGYEWPTFYMLSYHVVPVQEPSSPFHLSGQKLWQAQVGYIIYFPPQVLLEAREGRLFRRQRHHALRADDRRQRLLPGDFTLRLMCSAGIAS